MVQSTSNPQYFINLILHELVTPDEKRLKALSLQLVQKNAALGMRPDGFFYRGKVFFSDSKSYGEASKGNLHPSLYDDGDMLVRQYDKVAKDGERIRQYLALCFVAITPKFTITTGWTKQDVRDVLNEGVVDLVPELRSMSRTRPEGYCILPEHREQWEKRKAIVEEYIAMRFFS
jgi:hypothetical protein